MKLVDRIMSISPQRRLLRKYAHRKASSYVALTKRARRIIDELARETNATPDEVLRRSITIYKMALDDRKKSAQAVAASPAS